MNELEAPRFGQPTVPPLAPLRASAEGVGDLQIVLESHRICMVIPAGSTVDANTLNLPGGLLILGALRGKVYCASGSVIIAKGGEFQGIVEACDIVIEGKVTSSLDSVGKPQPLSTVKARGYKDETGHVKGGIIAVSEHAFVCAQMTAIGYHIPRDANLSLSTFKTIIV